MARMQLDHLSYAAGPEGLAATADRLGDELGAQFHDGGFHPRFGTRNQTLALADGVYLEVVEVLDHPAADKAPFGQAVRERSSQGGGWLGWVVAADDLAPIEGRLGRSAVEGQRHLPDGTLLQWQQLGVLGLQSDPQLPFFIRWLDDGVSHPSAGGGDIVLTGIEVVGNRETVEEWLGGATEVVLSGLEVRWLPVGEHAGLTSASFRTPRGDVRV